MPIPINATSEEAGFATPEALVYTGAAVPAVYRFVRELPSDAVLAELPFGAPGYELRYVYYSTGHWRQLVNGYSGGAPASYRRRVALLADPLRDAAAAWQALIEAGTTHVIVHEAAFLGNQSRPVMEWLDRRGATRLAGFGPDQVWELPGSRARPPR